MCIGTKNIPETKFDSRTILKQCLKKASKQHIRGRKTKSKEDLSELTASEEEFFIDLTLKNSCIMIYTLLSKIFEICGSILISDPR